MPYLLLSLPFMPFFLLFGVFLAATQLSEVLDMYEDTIGTNQFWAPCLNLAQG